MGREMRREQYYSFTDLDALNRWIEKERGKNMMRCGYRNLAYDQGHDGSEGFLVIPSEHTSTDIERAWTMANNEASMIWRDSTIVICYMPVVDPTDPTKILQYVASLVEMSGHF